ncbi:cytidine deaminase [Agrilactobacillus fermenti]|uniref:cytidine deaminase n=1 Tax=Agrilactobacillus fermenti TaxID=2586909 RepID=UPI001E2D90A1|nr:cytidine deaminase [Agrilactobacillus fermenti]
MDSNSIINVLFNAADTTLQHAYIPYSHFPVAAALRTPEGKIFSGCNVENASYGLTICAERNAIFSAVSQGYQVFDDLLILSRSVKPMPCGACRQVMAEFMAPTAKIYVATQDKQLITYTLTELLPYSFKKEHLNHD